MQLSWTIKQSFPSTILSLQTYTDSLPLGHTNMANLDLPAVEILSLSEPAPDSTGNSAIDVSEASTTSSGDTTSLSDTTTSTIKLLDLPPEVLRLICEEVFSSYNEVYEGFTTRCIASTLKVASPRYALGDRSNNIEDDRRMPHYTHLTPGYSHLGLPRGTLSLLSVCSQLYEVGSPAFYGLYEFRTTSAESFRLLFTKHIGAMNLKSIRRLSIGLPHGIKIMPSKYIGRYTRMLDNRMPQLQNFIITTKFGRWNYPVTLNPRHTWVECHRGMLWFGAWVTRSHPQLKYAVWDEKNTVFQNKLDDQVLGSFDSRPDVELTVTISSIQPKDLQVMRDPRIIQARNEALVEVMGEPEIGEFGDIIDHRFHPLSGLPLDVEVVEPATRMLLNSWEIRRQGFVGLSTLGTCRPYAYQLPISARNSEAATPVENSMNEQVLLEELFLHNKTPEKTLAMLPVAKYNTNTLFLRAKALEAKNIEEEMIMKRGELPPEPPAQTADDDPSNQHDHLEQENADDVSDPLVGPYNGMDLTGLPSDDSTNPPDGGNIDAYDDNTFDGGNDGWVEGWGEVSGEGWGEHSDYDDNYHEKAHDEYQHSECHADIEDGYTSHDASETTDVYTDGTSSDEAAFGDAQEIFDNDEHLPDIETHADTEESAAPDTMPGEFPDSFA